MRILQLCTRIPFPPDDGGSIAMYNLAGSLADARCTVKVLAFNTKKHFVAAEDINKAFSERFSLETVYLDASLKPLAAFLNLFSKQSYNIRRFISGKFSRKLSEILAADEYDVVQMESLFMAPYLDTVRKFSKAKVVLRAHNVEHIIWQRLYAAEKNIFKRIYLKLLSGRLFNYEKSVINHFDALLPMTACDEKTFKQMGCRVQIHVTPIGIDVASYKISDDQARDQMFTLFHLGSMDWMPNIEAVDWFLENVWKDLVLRIPGVELHLAGKAMPERIFREKSSNLIVYGKITDAKSFIAGKQVMIVPLHSGSGMRVKILEGLASGKAIISTTVGAEGIKYTDRKNIFIADSPQQFADGIEQLFKDKNLLDSISSNAIRLAEEEYDNKIIAEQLIDFYGTLIPSQNPGKY